jgi:hypothetical protein
MVGSPIPVKATASVRDLVLWIDARIAQGADRFVLIAAGAFRASPVARWRTGDPFDRRATAVYVQNVADGLLALGSPREHFELRAYRGRRMRASVVVYGREVRAYQDEDSRDETIARLRAELERTRNTATEVTTEQRSVIVELRARIEKLWADLDQADDLARDLLAASDAAKRAVPWTFGRTRRPVPRDDN